VNVDGSIRMGVNRERENSKARSAIGQPFLEAPVGRRQTTVGARTSERGVSITAECQLPASCRLPTAYWLLGEVAADAEGETGVAAGEAAVCCRTIDVT
jgi:hypothetical protein